MSVLVCLNEDGALINQNRIQMDGERPCMLLETCTHGPRISEISFEATFQVYCKRDNELTSKCNKGECENCNYIR